MKSTIPILTVMTLTALALAGCDQSKTGSSTDAQSTNSSASDTGSVAGGITNAPATNNVPDLNTNSPANTNQ